MLVRENFGKSVRKLRREREMSQEELANICGLDRSYIGGVERGERNPSLVAIEKIALALSVPISVLFENVPIG